MRSFLVIATLMEKTRVRIDSTSEKFLTSSSRRDGARKRKFAATEGDQHFKDTSQEKRRRRTQCGGEKSQMDSSGTASIYKAVQAIFQDAKSVVLDSARHQITEMRKSGRNSLMQDHQFVRAARRHAKKVKSLKRKLVRSIKRSVRGRGIERDILDYLTHRSLRNLGRMTELVVILIARYSLFQDSLALSVLNSLVVAFSYLSFKEKLPAGSAALMLDGIICFEICMRTKRVPVVSIFHWIALCKMIGQDFAHCGLAIEELVPKSKAMPCSSSLSDIPMCATDCTQLSLKETSHQIFGVINRLKFDLSSEDMVDGRAHHEMLRVIKEVKGFDIGKACFQHSIMANSPYERLDSTFGSISTCNTEDDTCLECSICLDTLKTLVQKKILLSSLCVKNSHLSTLSLPQEKITNRHQATSINAKKHEALCQANKKDSHPVNEKTDLSPECEQKNELKKAVQSNTVSIQKEPKILSKVEEKPRDKKESCTQLPAGERKNMPQQIPTGSFLSKTSQGQDVEGQDILEDLSRNKKICLASFLQMVAESKKFVLQQSLYGNVKDEGKARDFAKKLSPEVCKHIQSLRDLLVGHSMGKMLENYLQFDSLQNNDKMTELLLVLTLGYFLYPDKNFSTFYKKLLLLFSYNRFKPHIKAKEPESIFRELCIFEDQMQSEGVPVISIAHWIAIGKLTKYKDKPHGLFKELDSMSREEFLSVLQTNSAVVQQRLPGDKIKDTSNDSLQDSSQVQIHSNNPDEKTKGNLMEEQGISKDQCETKQQGFLPCSSTSPQTVSSRADISMVEASPSRTEMKQDHCLAKKERGCLETRESKIDKVVENLLPEVMARVNQAQEFVTRQCNDCLVDQQLLERAKEHAVELKSEARLVLGALKHFVVGHSRQVQLRAFLSSEYLLNSKRATTAFLTLLVRCHLTHDTVALNVFNILLAVFSHDRFKVHLVSSSSAQAMFAKIGAFEKCMREEKVPLMSVAQWISLCLLFTPDSANYCGLVVGPLDRIDKSPEVLAMTSQSLFDKLLQGLNILEGLYKKKTATGEDGAVEKIRSQMGQIQVGCYKSAAKVHFAIMKLFLCQPYSDDQLADLLDSIPKSTPGLVNASYGVMSGCSSEQTICFGCEKCVSVQLENTKRSLLIPKLRVNDYDERIKELEGRFQQENQS